MAVELAHHQLVAPGKIRRAAALQPVGYVVFDLLQFKGQSLLSRPLRERRQRLEDLLSSSGLAGLVFSQGTVHAGRQYFEEAIKQGHEGVMAKHLDAPYRPGRRSSDWRKIKPRQETVCVIVGYRQIRGRLSSLLLARGAAWVLQGQRQAAGAGRMAVELAATSRWHPPRFAAPPRCNRSVTLCCNRSHSGE